MYKLKFWKDTGERAFNTFWQTLVSAMLAGPVFSVLEFDWQTGATVALSAVVLSVAKSFVVGSVSKDDSVSPVSLVSDHKTGV